MSVIHRDIYVTRHQRIQPIDIVRGSQVGIELQLMDYEIPTGASAKAYARGRYAPNTYVSNCTVSGKTVSFIPPDGFFVPGLNRLQIEINGVIIPFSVDVECEPRISDGGGHATPEQVKPLVEQAETAAEQAETAAAAAEATLDEIHSNYPAIPEMSNAISGLKKDLSSLHSKVGRTYNLDYIIGSLSGVTGKPVTHPNRICTENIQKTEAETTITLKDLRYRFSITVFTDEGGETIEAGYAWRTAPLVLPKDTYFRLMISSGTSSDAETAVTDEMKIEMTKSVVLSYDGTMKASVSLTNGFTKIEEPPGFVWNDSSVHDRLFKNNGKIYCGYSVREHKPTGKIYYVDCVNGDDSADGSFRNPFQSIAAAYNKDDVVEIKLFPGDYISRYSFGNFVTKSIAITTVFGSKARIIAAQNVTWYKVDGRNNVYQGYRPNAIAVIDGSSKNASGDYKRFTSVESIASVDSVENSYFVDGDYVYVHSLDAPTDEIFVLLNSCGISVRYNSANVFYAENIEFIGGCAGALQLRSTTTDNTAAYLYNCLFTHSQLGDGSLSASSNGLSAQSFTVVECEKCVASCNYDDGFNYHKLSTNTILPKSIEIDCIGRNNGVTGGTDNGSTTHDGCQAIRINCEYYGNDGPQVADVSDNTRSWNIGCFAHDANQYDADYKCQDGTAVMWLDSCKTSRSNSRYALSCGRDNSAAAMFIRDSEIVGEIEIGNMATMREY